MVRLLVGTAVTGLLSAAFIFYSEHEPMDALRACGKIDDVGGFRACLSEHVPRVLASDGAVAIMHMYEKEFTPSRCHDAGHLLGRKLYERNASLEYALLQCTESCASACVHGVVGVAVASSPQLRDAFADNSALNRDALADVGTDACAERETCHALGHILYQLFKELDGSLGLCDVLANGKEPWSCYRGVFMENASASSSHVVFEDVRAPNVRDPDDLLSPCSVVAERYQPACFHNVHMNASMTLRERGVVAPGETADTILRACGAVSLSMQPACFEGVGSYLVISAHPIAEAVDQCLALGDVRNVAGCIFGFSYALSAWGRTGDALAACEGIASESVQYACYEGIADDLSVRPTRALDAMCATSAHVACSRALAHIRSGNAVRAVMR